MSADFDKRRPELVEGLSPQYRAETMAHGGGT